MDYRIVNVCVHDLFACVGIYISVHSLITRTLVEPAWNLTHEKSCCRH